MTITTTGYASIDDGRVFTGVGGVGTMVLAGGTYSFGGVDIGAKFDINVNPVAVGVTTMTGGVNVRVERQSGTAPFYGDVRVGFASNPNDIGVGVLVVEGGSTLTIENATVLEPGYNNGIGTLRGGYGNMTIGRGVGSEGIVRVTGTDSVLAAVGQAARMNVGRSGGSGELRIDSGGAVQTLSLSVGRSAPNTELASTGRIVVDGVGSRLVLSTDYGNYLPVNNGASGLFLGRESGGRGDLLISNGGRVLMENTAGVTANSFVHLGRGEGSIGTMRITGPGSRMDVVQDGAQAATGDGPSFKIGTGGQGLMTVERGGVLRLTGGDPILKVGAARDGIVSEDTSSLTIRSGGVVSVQGEGAQGATVLVGTDPGSQAVLRLSGAGSRLEVGALLAVATGVDFDAVGTPGFLDTRMAATGLLAIRNGAEVSAPRVVIGQGGTITGDGRVVGAVELTGTLAPDDADGVASLAISGNLTLRSGAVFDLDVAQLIDGQADLIALGGRLIGTTFDAEIDLGATARFGIGQRVTLLTSTLALPAINQTLTLDGFDFALKSVGGSLVLEALEARQGFSLAPSASAANTITLTSNAGAVSVSLGALAGQTATGVSFIDGSEQADRIVASPGLTRAMTIAAGAGDDVIETTAGAQRIFGEAGNDTITSRQGADTIDGGAGDDVISAFGGADTVLAGAGNDTISGGIGTDTLAGDAGNDTIRGDADADRIEGGAGIDRLVGGTGVDVFVFRLGFQTDQIADFDANGEKLDFTLHSGVDAFGDLTVVQQGAAVLITDGSGGRIILTGVNVAAITADDFLF